MITELALEHKVSQGRVIKTKYVHSLITARDSISEFFLDTFALGLREWASHSLSFLIREPSPSF